MCDAMREIADQMINVRSDEDGNIYRKDDPDAPQNQRRPDRLLIDEESRDEDLPVGVGGATRRRRIDEILDEAERGRR